MNDQNYLVLYNPISNEGHLDSWHVMFIHLLVNAGWNIIALSSDPNGLEIKLKNRGLLVSDQWKVIGLRHPNESFIHSCRRLLSRWNALGLAKTHSRSGVRDQLIFASYKITVFLRRKKNKVIASQPSHSTHLDPSEFSHQINQLIDMYPEKILGVLNMYIDAFMPESKSWQNFSFKENITWTGLCITPQQYPVEGYYFLERYRGTCFLDESMTDHYKVALPDKHFVYLPDITETALPEISSRLAADIKSQAKNRKIVFLGGSIGKQKNIARWLDLISKADTAKWFFVQIGRINTNNLTPEDERALKNVMKAPPENLMIKSSYLKDERDFNEIIALSDVIFAVYRDFTRSSNMLSKAAFFEKPILVAENSLMAQRVTQYGIGLAVMQDDTQHILEGLNALEHINSLKDKFLSYRNSFSEQALQMKLSKFIHTCVGK